MKDALFPAAASIAYDATTTDDARREEAMALVACPDCKAEVSDAAPTCPRCGRPMGAVPVAAVKIRKPALSYAGIGFLVGFCLVWGGCEGFGVERFDTRLLVMCIFGGGAISLLGAVIGAVIGLKRRS